MIIIPTQPTELNQDCLNIVYKIIQHEVGNMKSSEVFRFMAEQIFQDLNSIPCDNLTNWRWKIGKYSISNVKPGVIIAVTDVLNHWPIKEFPRCKFIGSLNDIKVWKKYGFNTEIGYRKTVGKLTVIGVDCNYKFIKSTEWQIKKYLKME